MGSHSGDAPQVSLDVFGSVLVPVDLAGPDGVLLPGPIYAQLLVNVPQSLFHSTHKYSGPSARDKENMRHVAPLQKLINVFNVICSNVLQQGCGSFLFGTLDGLYFHHGRF